MGNLPDIFCIHESDADLHLGHLQQISQKFIDERRVGKFVPLTPDEAITSLPADLKPKDLIILLLTDRFTLRRAEIKDLLVSMQQKHSNLIIAEVIIDNLQYDKDYISWPSDLAPIRSRDDMDSAWSAIESNLNEIIPRRQAVPWRKYIKPVAAVVVGALVIWLLFKLFGKDREPAFTLEIMDSKKNYKDTSACYLPCVALLTSDSDDFDSLIWNITDTDTTIRMVKKYNYLFGIPGEHTIQLTKVNGSKKQTATRKLLVKAPLVADFDAENDGCIAPCQIRFINKSGPGRLTWRFDGINDSSTEANPRKEYPNHGEFNVALSVVNEDNVRSDTVKKITIRQDDRPFADFSTKREGRFGIRSLTVEFINSSKNANDYTWDFGDGSVLFTGVSPTYTYSKSGTYPVKLTAARGEESDIEIKSISVGLWYGADLHIREAIELDPRLKAQARKLETRRIQTP